MSLHVYCDVQPQVYYVVSIQVHCDAIAQVYFAAPGHLRLKSSSPAIVRPDHQASSTANKVGAGAAFHVVNSVMLDP